MKLYFQIGFLFEPIVHVIDVPEQKITPKKHFVNSNCKSNKGFIQNHMQRKTQNSTFKHK